jgi:hypothetical protein
VHFLLFPLVENPNFIPSNESLDSYWISGFANGDGSFALGYEPSDSPTDNFFANPLFRISQHQRDEVLLNRIKSTLGCGFVYGPYGNSNTLEFQISGRSPITDKIIPFFPIHSLQGAKVLDLRDFSKGVSILKEGSHLTGTGLQQLIQLHRAMNSSRTTFS